MVKGGPLRPIYAQIYSSNNDDSKNNTTLVVIVLPCFAACFISALQELLYWYRLVCPLISVFDCPAVSHQCLSHYGPFRRTFSISFSGSASDSPKHSGQGGGERVTVTLVTGVCVTSRFLTTNKRLHPKLNTKPSKAKER